MKLDEDAFDFLQDAGPMQQNSKNVLSRWTQFNRCTSFGQTGKNQSGVRELGLCENRFSPGFPQGVWKTFYGSLIKHLVSIKSLDKQNSQHSM
jgi:hypothetical protein